MAAERSGAETAVTGGSMLAIVALWLLRLANTVLLAVGVWVLSLIVDRLDKLTGEIINLIDYPSVIAERLG
jgi:hypothetical protein